MFAVSYISNFNCTIQELKLVDRSLQRLQCHDFNCTIQELKRLKVHASSIDEVRISIAPYRN